MRPLQPILARRVFPLIEHNNNEMQISLTKRGD